jgi:hypothetical protein
VQKKWGVKFITLKKAYIFFFWVHISMKGCCLDPRHGKNMDIRKANATMAKDVFSKPDVHDLDTALFCLILPPIESPGTAAESCALK